MTGYPGVAPRMTSQLATIRSERVTDRVYHDWNYPRQFNSDGREIDFRAAQGKDKRKRAGALAITQKRPLMISSKPATLRG